MEQEILDELHERLQHSFDAFKRETNKLRTGRANAGLLDGVRVDYYGNESPIGQVATISVVDARLLQVKPWERTMCGPIEKALLAANLGLTPANRGDVVLVPVPAPTGDRRREMVKILKHLAEEAKISTRNGRRDAIDMIDLIEDMPEDDVTRAKKKVQDAVDAASKRIDAFVVEKEAEILEV